VNTSDSRVELRWDPRTSSVVTGVAKDRLRQEFVVTASEHRSQLQNRQAARHRLARRVASALAGPRKRRRRTRPTGASVTRRLDAKRKRSAVKAQRRRPTAEG
jgi:ribosome-associated protein